MNVFPAPPLLFAKHMPALLFFVYEKDRKEERKRIACQPTRKVLFKVLTILDSKKRKRARQNGRKKKKKSGVASSKRYEKKKRRRARYALCVGDIFFKTTLRCFARAFKKCGDLKF
jgi:hypothetical protein